MKRASVAELRAHLSDWLKSSERDPVLITKNGKPIAMVVGVDEGGEFERYLMSRSPKLNAILSAAEKRFDAGQGIPDGEFWAEMLAKKPCPPRTRRPTKSKLSVPSL